MNILEYKGYEGTAEIDQSMEFCFGKILFINDLVTYKANSPLGLQKSFEEAVDDYIETCQLLKRQPEKPLKGVFNVRVRPELHKQAVIRALRNDTSLNDVVSTAIETYLSSGKHVNVTIEMHGRVKEKVGSYRTDRQSWVNTSVTTH